MPRMTKERMNEVRSRFEKLRSLGHKPVGFEGLVVLMNGIAKEETRIGSMGTIARVNPNDAPEVQERARTALAAVRARKAARRRIVHQQYRAAETLMDTMHRAQDWY